LPPTPERQRSSTPPLKGQTVPTNLRVPAPYSASRRQLLCARPYPLSFLLFTCPRVPDRLLLHVHGIVDLPPPCHRCEVKFLQQENIAAAAAPFSSLRQTRVDPRSIYSCNTSLFLDFFTRLLTCLRPEGNPPTRGRTPPQPSHGEAFSPTPSLLPNSDREHSSRPLTSLQQPLY